MIFGSLFRRVSSGSGRFRQTQFQERIRAARAFRRSPKIAPEGRANVSLNPFHFTGIWIAAVFIFLFGTVVYFVRFSPLLLVTDVRVSGNKQVSSEEIAQAITGSAGEYVYGMISRSHMLMMEESKLERVLLPRFPKILRVKRVKRILPHTVEVEVEERFPIAVIESGSRYFYVGQDGIVSDPLPDSYATSTDSYALIRSSTPRQFTVGENINAPALLEFMKISSELWQKYFSSPYRTILYEGSASPDIYVTTSAGWTAYFDLKNDPRLSLKNLHLVFSQQITAERESQLAYVDVRLPTMAYYCFRGEPCAAVTTPLQPEQMPATGK